MLIAGCGARSRRTCCIFGARCAVMCRPILGRRFSFSVCLFCLSFLLSSPVVSTFVESLCPLRALIYAHIVSLFVFLSVCVFFVARSLFSSVCIFFSSVCAVLFSVLPLSLS